jgi:hypothetical protein
MPPHSIKPGRTHSQDRLAGHEPSHGTVCVASRTRWLLTSCLLVGALVLIASLTGAQTGSIVVEDWSKQPSGKRGIPNGWQGQNWGSPKYDFTVVIDDSAPAIHLKSDNDSSTISREITVDVKQYPMLQWRWKVVALPKAGDARKKETDDEAAQLYVTFPRFPSAVRSRIIGYIWDSNAPVGAIFPSQKVSTITYLVVRSGDADLGKWLTETRNVLNDFKQIYGENPGESVGAVAISINSQNTNARAESYVGEILFRKP